MKRREEEWKRTEEGKRKQWGWEKEMQIKERRGRKLMTRGGVRGVEGR